MIFLKSAIILAGGKGSRLGYTDKAFLKFNDTTFIELLIKKLILFDEIIIVSNNPDSYKTLSFMSNSKIKIISDVVKDIGPLGGIYSGLLAAKYNESLVISCDTPLIHQEFLKYLYDLKSESIFSIPISKNGIEPLIALYKKMALSLVENAIKNKNYKLRTLFTESNTSYIPLVEMKNHQEIEKSFFNINTTEDLEEMWNFLK